MFANDKYFGILTINIIKLNIKMMLMKKLFFVIALMLISLVGVQAQSLVGKSVSTLSLIDPNDNPKAIPGLGEKVVMVFYTDPDVKDVNDPLSDAIREKKYSKDKYAGVGVANCKDTWLPNAGIRMKARQKEKEFPSSVILLDESHSLVNSWGLGDCDDKAVVIVVGRDKKIKYHKVISTQAESKSIIPTVIALIEKEML